MAQYPIHKQTSRTQNLSYKIHVVIKIRYAQDITEIKVNVVHKISTQDIYNFILMKWYVSLLLISQNDVLVFSIIFFLRFRSVPPNTNTHTGNGIPRNGTES